MSRFVKGGYLPGPPIPLPVRVLGHTAEGVTIVSIGGGRPELLLTPPGPALLAAMRSRLRLPFEVWENEGGAL